MYTVLTVIHVLACVSIIGVVLLQQGKGADMGAVFGGSSQTLFGSSGAGNFLTRTTAGLAAVFIVTSLTLAYGSASRMTKTIFDDAPLAEPAGSEPAGSAPAPEGAPAAQPAPQADAAPAAESKGGGVAVVDSGTGAAVVETGKEAAENLAAEAKEAGSTVAGAAQAVGADVTEGAQEAGQAVDGAAVEAKAAAVGAAEGAENAAKAVQEKAVGAADKIVGGEVEEAPGDTDQIPPVAAP